jgi:hypothetical protein
LVTAKPARRRDSARGLGNWLARKKKKKETGKKRKEREREREREREYVGSSHRGLSASLRKRQITKIMEAA